MKRDQTADIQAARELWHTMLRTFHRLRSSIRPVFAEYNLTGPQWRVVRMLGEAGEEGLMPGQISEQLLVTQGNTTGIVDKLEEAGLVQRLPHPEDGRALLIRFTPQGEEIYQQVQPVLDARVAEMFGCLSLEQMSDLTGLLRRVMEHVDTISPGSCRGCGGNKESV